MKKMACNLKAAIEWDYQLATNLKERMKNGHSICRDFNWIKKFFVLNMKDEEIWSLFRGIS